MMDDFWLVLYLGISGAILDLLSWILETLADMLDWLTAETPQRR